MYVTCKSGIFIFPVILVLENTRVYACGFNSCNITTDVKASINKHFSIQAILGIPNINPNDYYV